MKKLLDLQYNGWWVQVSPLAAQGEWICAIYKLGKKFWVTEECRSFDNPDDAYEWAFSKIQGSQFIKHQIGTL